MMDLKPIKNKESEDFIIYYPLRFDAEDRILEIKGKMRSMELFERKKVLFSLGYRIGVGNRK